MNSGSKLARTRETGAKTDVPPARAVDVIRQTALDEPAHVYLSTLPWDGPRADPDALEARAFLARL